MGVEPVEYGGLGSEKVGVLWRELFTLVYVVREGVFWILALLKTDAEDMYSDSGTSMKSYRGVQTTILKSYGVSLGILRAGGDMRPHR